MWRSVLLTLSGLLLFLPVSARAADCYFLAGYGPGEYREDQTGKFEDRILANDFIDGGYQTQMKSRPRQFGGGCDLNRYLAVEGAYFQGLRTSVDTTLTTCATVLGERHCTSSERIARKAWLQGWELSVLGKLPIDNRWSLTGRLGALVGEAQVTVAFPGLSDEIVLSKRETGATLVAGVGVLYRPSRHWALGLEYKMIGPDGRAAMATLRWYF